MVDRRVRVGADSDRPCEIVRHRVVVWGPDPAVEAELRPAAPPTLLIAHLLSLAQRREDSVGVEFRLLIIFHVSTRIVLEDDEPRFSRRGIALWSGLAEQESHLVPT